MNDKTLNIDKSKNAIGKMFDSIAHRYDFLNHFLSFGIDRYWRKRAADIILDKYTSPLVLDVATGTADLAIEVIRRGASRVTGIDISYNMLEAGRRKIKKKKLEDKIDLIHCDSQNICFDDNSFDVAMVAFGVRNFEDPVRGLSEMTRVLRLGGLLVVLEFSKPDGFIFKHVYNFYFRNLLPLAGAVISGRGSAYSYLNQSVMQFAERDEFKGLMQKAGLSEISQIRLTGGVSTIYSGVKK